MHQRVRILIFLCAIAFFTLLAYSNTFSVPFLLDDYFHIVENPYLRHPGHIRELLESGRPTVQLTFALNYTFGGLNVAGYHIINLVIHILAALTLFGVVRRTLLLERIGFRNAQAENFAFVTALLWALHPLETQSVTYIVQRSESLAGLFCLLTIYTFLRSHVSNTKKSLWLAFSSASCWLGIFSKQTMVSAPILIFLFDWVLTQNSPKEIFRKRWFCYLSLFLSYVALFGVLQLKNPSEVSESAGFGLQLITPFEYARTQPGVILHYLKLAIWPTSLCFDYAWPIASINQALIPSALIGASFILGLVAIRFSPSIGFLTMAFFLILSPTSSVMPIADLAVEHRMYLPLVCVIILLVAAGRRFLKKVPILVLFSGICVLSACFGVMTFERNRVYASEETLWRDTVQKMPLNPRAHENLGEALERNEKYSEAITHYEQALALKPEFAKAHNNLGKALDRSGHLDEAILHYKEALRIDPELEKAYSNLGAALQEKGNFEEALSHYEKAAQLNPFFEGTYANWGSLLFRMGKREEAIQKFSEALTLKPDFVEAHNNLGAVLASEGKLNEAIQHFEKALEFKPDYSDAQQNLERAKRAKNLKKI